jgi:release factor glutamine methyltransferase
MNKEKLFDTLRTDLGTKLIFLEDKPEETVESTLKALWLKASGVSLSAEIALISDLPELSSQQINTLNHLIELRLANTPLAYLTGRQNFMGIEFICDRRALIPRKETEILGRKALELSMEISRNTGRTTIIDVCCGAGNLGLTLAYLNPDTTVFATDLSQDAVELARENACFLKLDQRINIKQGDLLSAFESDEYYEKVDLIVCNPPYISSSKASKLDQEISANEPLLAFDGGAFGTNVIQKLIKDAPRYLKKNGWLIFEVGLGQGEFIMQLCKKTKQFDQVGTQNDNRGNVRVVYAKK